MSVWPATGYCFLQGLPYELDGSQSLGWRRQQSWRITHGNLRVLTFNNIYKFLLNQPKKNDNDLKVELRVAVDVFWVRLALMSDLGFAEAYVCGDVEYDDLVAISDLPGELGKPGQHKLDAILPLLNPAKVTSYRFPNTLGNPRSNLVPTYLHTMTSPTIWLYACAILEDLDGDLKNDIPQSKWTGEQCLQRVSPRAPTAMNSNWHCNKSGNGASQSSN